MMETVSGRYSLQQDQYSPHIKRVLKSYQSTAMNSLSGPRDYVHFRSDVEDDNEYIRSKVPCSTVKPVTTASKTVPKKRTCEPDAAAAKGGSDSDSAREASPIRRIPYPPPILSAPDQTWSELGETSLEGETISCFSVGGEKRLCLPQVLNSVLRGVSITQIHGVCDELHIFCSTCSKEQLDVLKKSGILPPSASQCGLITKTDAERLCSELLNSSAPQLLKSEFNSPGHKQRVNVHHKCFGKCRGSLRPELYTSPMARCIECAGCRGLFAPVKFVSHTHENREARTVHWGFDSSNWRNYLLLCPDQQDVDSKELILKEFKNKFDLSLTLKRKQAGAVGDEDEESAVCEEKRRKVQEFSSDTTGAVLYPPTHAYMDPAAAALYRYYSWPYVAAASLPRLLAAHTKEQLPPPPAISKAATYTATAAAAAAALNGLCRDVPAFLAHEPPSVLLHPDHLLKETNRTVKEVNLDSPTPKPATATSTAKSPSAAATTDETSGSAAGACELVADLEAAVSRVSAAVEPLSPADQDTVVDTVRALAEEISRLRAENKSKTSLLEERTARLHDLMSQCDQEDAASRHSAASPERSGRPEESRGAATPVKQEADETAEQPEREPEPALDCVLRPGGDSG